MFWKLCVVTVTEKQKLEEKVKPAQTPTMTKFWLKFQAKATTVILSYDCKKWQMSYIWWMCTKLSVSISILFGVQRRLSSSCQRFSQHKAVGLHRSWCLSVRRRNLRTETDNRGITYISTLDLNPAITIAEAIYPHVNNHYLFVFKFNRPLEENNSIKTDSNSFALQLWSLVTVAFIYQMIIETSTELGVKIMQSREMCISGQRLRPKQETNKKNGAV